MRNGNAVALWGGVSSFFATVLALGTIDILNPDDRVQFIGGVVVGLITAGAVYAKQRLDDAKAGRVQGGKIIMTETGDKTVFSLELDGDPEDLQHQKEIIFKVEKRGVSG